MVLSKSDVWHGFCKEGSNNHRDDGVDNEDEDDNDNDDMMTNVVV